MTVESPKDWEESDARYISKAEEVRLRSFTTKVRESAIFNLVDPNKIHKVDTTVAYRRPD